MPVDQSDWLCVGVCRYIGRIQPPKECTDKLIRPAGHAIKFKRLPLRNHTEDVPCTSYLALMNLFVKEISAPAYI